MCKSCCSCSSHPTPARSLPGWRNAGVEPTVRAYGGDLRQGFAASRDGPRTITRWTMRVARRDERCPGPHHAARRRCAMPPSPRRRAAAVCSCRGRPARPLAAQGDAFWWGRKDILDLEAPFAGFRRVVARLRPRAPRACRTASLRCRSMAGPAAAADCSPPALRRTAPCSTGSKPESGRRDWCGFRSRCSRRRRAGRCR